MENCFIKSNVVITAASGWLQRLVRRFGERMTDIRMEKQYNKENNNTNGRRAIERDDQPSEDPVVRDKRVRNQQNNANRAATEREDQDNPGPVMAAKEGITQ